MRRCFPDSATRATFWSSALFLGWFLAFPLSGPLLGALVERQGSDAALLGLSFTLAQGVGLMAAGRWLSPRRWREACGWSLAACFMLSGAAYWSRPELLPVWLVGLGLASALFLIGWSYPYVNAVAGNRVRFMAAVTFTANVVLYVVNLLLTVLPPVAVYLAVTLLLPASGLFLRGQTFPERSHPLPVRASFPLGLMWVLCLVIFGLYVSGGFLYNVIYPAFLAQRRPLYENAPYLAMLMLIIVLGNKHNRRFAPYLGVTLLGVGFVVFGLLGTSLLSYFLTEGLILAAFAVLDVFVWTLLADIGELHGHSLQVFGFGLAANVFALFAGGLLSTRLGVQGPDYPLLTGLFASGAICATVMLLPVMHARAAEDLAERVPELPVSSPAGTAPSELVNCFPGAPALTERETEILGLVIGGDSNSAIARRLFISENTVKVHIKNINRKLGIANRYELLVTLMKRRKEDGALANGQ
jgi:DNA-binding CsgD family transcriptional regulator